MELKYEIETGLIQNEIDEEELTYKFIFPISKKIPDGVVLCEFKLRPTNKYNVCFNGIKFEPKLKVVK